MTAPGFQSDAHRAKNLEPNLTDILRIHVVWASGSNEGARIAEMISRHFDGIGMERDGVAYRVPVRFASEPWHEPSPLPKPLDLDRAVHNAVILLHDDLMHEDAEQWDGWVQATRASMEERGKTDVYVPFGSPTGEPALRLDRAQHTQYAYRKKWMALADPDARDKRLLLHALHRIRQHLRQSFGMHQDEPLFVSHAKADGDTTARAIVDFVNSSGHDVPLHTFYDAMELSPGEDFKQSFKTEIGHGTLIAIVSDVYDSRPWCVFELTTAKRERRPIVLADVGGVRISRTFPYGANLPRVRLKPDPSSDAWIEPLLVEALSEGLRCDLFEAQALKLLSKSSADALVLPRPPELFDIVDRPVPDTIIYPDPPLGDIEADLLRKALDAIAPGSRFVTLGELTWAP